MKSGLYVRAVAVLALQLGICAGAQAFDFDWSDAHFSLNSHLSEGAAWRLERQDPHLIGKQDLPGQQTLCATDGCLSFSATPNPEPNLRLVKAGGAFSGVNTDQGDLNFDQYSVVAADTKLDSNLFVRWHGFSFKLSGTALFDPVNASLQNVNGNTQFFGAGYLPDRSDAPAATRRLTGRSVVLRDAALSYSTFWADRNFAISVGQQTVHWGESSYVALNSINEINPPDERLYHIPGVQLSQIFQPVPLVKINADILENLSLEAIYQLGWKPVITDQPGSFYSDKNFLGEGGNPLDITLGQIPMDPNNIGYVPGIAQLISDTTTTVHMQPQRDHYPSDNGQYGAHLSYFAPNLLNGTEFGLYYLRYNARLPSFSIMASDKSCLHDLQADSNALINLVNATVACKGFKGITGSILNPGGGLEPLPFDTVKPFMEYPEGIHLYGLSFNTNIFGWSLSGEYSYRDNLPLQVALPDVVYASEQPALPTQDISLGVLGTIPSGESYFPSYLMHYRGQDLEHGNPIQAHQYIPGYVRLKVGQVDFTALKAIPNGNWLRADQIVLVTEVGATQIYNMPDKSQLQLETGDPNSTHASPGADGTGGNMGSYTLRFNPTQQTTGFGSRFAWGVRLQARLEYDDFFRGINYKPQILLQRDFSGTSPFPIQNFIEGRTQLTADNLFNINNAWSFELIYQMNTGGVPVNTQYDRDTIAAVIAYDF